MSQLVRVLFRERICIPPLLSRLLCGRNLLGLAYQALAGGLGGGKEGKWGIFITPLSPLTFSPHGTGGQ